MKIPSLSYLAAKTATAFSRFYTPMLFAIGGSVIAMQMVNDSSPQNIRALLSCVLGLSLSLALMIYAERRKNSNLRHLLSLVSLVLTAAYWYWLAPVGGYKEQERVMTFAVLAVVMHLLVAIAPYIGVDERKGFWRYNEMLFARFLLSGIFSGVLFAGLALALLSANTLFDLDLSDNIYAYLWVLTAGIFNTWFFIAGVPSDYTALDEDRPFPVMLKIFVQYILIPLVILYLLILYIYGIKILITWQLPRGMVSSLILGYAVAGMLALLLAEPLYNNKGTAWVGRFSKLFFRATVPLIVLLYTAIATRVLQYGITEDRYYLILLGLWLGFISSYFILSGQKNIKVIPQSLAIVGFLSVLGPWSAFNVSVYSQRHRLATIMHRYKLQQAGPGKAVRMKERDANEVNEVIKYFVERQSVDELQPLFAASLKKTSDRVDSGRNAAYYWRDQSNVQQELYDMVCIYDLSLPATYEGPKHVNAATQAGFDIGGYSRFYDRSIDADAEDRDTLMNGIKAELRQTDTSSDICFVKGDSVLERISLVPLVKLIRAENPEYEFPAEQMTVTGTGPLSPRVVIRNIDVNAEDPANNGRHMVLSIEAWILMK